MCAICELPPYEGDTVMCLCDYCEEELSSTAIFRDGMWMRICQACLDMEARWAMEEFVASTKKSVTAA